MLNCNTMEDEEASPPVVDEIYRPKDIVWVKISSMWWPAEVQDQSTLDPEITEGLKKPPLAVVKFLMEDTYDHVRSYDHIFHYQCRRKMEFIQRGFKKYKSLKNEKNMKIFPQSLQEAECLTGGDLRILEHPDIVQMMEKDDENSKNPPSRKSMPALVHKKTKKSSRPSLPTNLLGPLIASPPSSQCGVSRSSVDYLFSGNVVEKIQSKTPSDITQPIDVYQCRLCSYKTQSFGLMVFHYQNKLHNGSFGTPVMHDSKPSKGKKLKNDTPATTGKKRKKARKDHMMDTSTVPVSAKKPRTSNANLEVSQECVQILQDWSDEETNDTGKDMRNDHLGNSDSIIVDDEQPENQVNIEIASTSGACTSLVSQQISKSSSCFDFDDEETLENFAPVRKFGQKLPRPEKSKPFPPTADGRGIDEFLSNEVSVPVIPSLPSHMKSDKSSFGKHTINEQENDDLQVNKAGNNHFLVEGPLQENKRRKLIEGTEDGSVASKKSKRSEMFEKPSASSDSSDIIIDVRKKQKLRTPKEVKTFSKKRLSETSGHSKDGLRLSGEHTSKSAKSKVNRNFPEKVKLVNNEKNHEKSGRQGRSKAQPEATMVKVGAGTLAHKKFETSGQRSKSGDDSFCGKSEADMKFKKTSKKDRVLNKFPDSKKDYDSSKKHRIDLCQTKAKKLNPLRRSKSLTGSGQDTHNVNADESHSHSQSADKGTKEAKVAAEFKSDTLKISKNRRNSNEKTTVSQPDLTKDVHEGFKTSKITTEHFAKKIPTESPTCSKPKQGGLVLSDAFANSLKETRAPLRKKKIKKSVATSPNRIVKKDSPAQTTGPKPAAKKEDLGSMNKTRLDFPLGLPQPFQKVAHGLKAVTKLQCDSKDDQIKISDATAKQDLVENSVKTSQNIPLEPSVTSKKDFQEQGASSNLPCDARDVSSSLSTGMFHNVSKTSPNAGTKSEAVGKLVSEPQVYSVAKSDASSQKLEIKSLEGIEFCPQSPGPPLLTAYCKDSPKSVTLLTHSPKPSPSSQMSPPQLESQSVIDGKDVPTQSEGHGMLIKPSGSHPVSVEGIKRLELPSSLENLKNDSDFISLRESRTKLTSQKHRTSPKKVSIKDYTLNPSYRKQANATITEATGNLGLLSPSKPYSASNWSKDTTESSSSQDPSFSSLTEEQIEVARLVPGQNRKGNSHTNEFPQSKELKPEFDLELPELSTKRKSENRSDFPEFLSSTKICTGIKTDPAELSKEEEIGVTNRNELELKNHEVQEKGFELAKPTRKSLESTNATGEVAKEQLETANQGFLHKPISIVVPQDEVESDLDSCRNNKLEVKLASSSGSTKSVVEEQFKKKEVAQCEVSSTNAHQADSRKIGQSNLEVKNYLADTDDVPPSLFVESVTSQQIEHLAPTKEFIASSGLDSTRSKKLLSKLDVLHDGTTEKSGLEERLGMKYGRSESPSFVVCQRDMSKHHPNQTAVKTDLTGTDYLESIGLKQEELSTPADASVETSVHVFLKSKELVAELPSKSDSTPGINVLKEPIETECVVQHQCFSPNAPQAGLSQIVQNNIEANFASGGEVEPNTKESSPSQTLEYAVSSDHVSPEKEKLLKLPSIKDTAPENSVYVKQKSYFPSLEEVLPSSALEEQVESKDTGLSESSSKSAQLKMNNVVTHIELGVNRDPGVMADVEFKQKKPPTPSKDFMACSNHGSLGSKNAGMNEELCVTPEVGSHATESLDKLPKVLCSKQDPKETPTNQIEETSTRTWKTETCKNVFLEKNDPVEDRGVIVSEQNLEMVFLSPPLEDIPLPPEVEPKKKVRNSLKPEVTPGIFEQAAVANTTKEEKGKMKKIVESDHGNLTDASKLKPRIRQAISCDGSSSFRTSSGQHSSPKKVFTSNSISVAKSKSQTPTALKSENVALLDKCDTKSKLAYGAAKLDQDEIETNVVKRKTRSSDLQHPCADTKLSPSPKKVPSKSGKSPSEDQKQLSRKQHSRKTPEKKSPTKESQYSTVGKLQGKEHSEVSSLYHDRKSHDLTLEKSELPRTSKAKPRSSIQFEKHPKTKEMLQSSCKESQDPYNFDHEDTSPFKFSSNKKHFKEKSGSKPSSPPFDKEVPKSPLKKHSKSEEIKLSPTGRDSRDSTKSPVKTSRWDKPYPLKMEEQRASTPTKAIHSPLKQSPPQGSAKCEIYYGYKCLKPLTADSERKSPTAASMESLVSQLSDCTEEMPLAPSETVKPVQNYDELKAVSEEILSYSEADKKKAELELAKQKELGIQPKTEFETDAEKTDSKSLSATLSHSQFRNLSSEKEGDLKKVEQLQIDTQFSPSKTSPEKAIGSTEDRLALLASLNDDDGNVSLEPSTNTLIHSGGDIIEESLSLPVPRVTVEPPSSKKIENVSLTHPGTDPKKMVVPTRLEKMPSKSSLQVEKAVVAEPEGSHSGPDSYCIENFCRDMPQDAPPEFISVTEEVVTTEIIAQESTVLGKPIPITEDTPTIISNEIIPSSHPFFPSATAEVKVLSSQYIGTGSQSLDAFDMELDINSMPFLIEEDDISTVDVPYQQLVSPTTSSATSDSVQPSQPTGNPKIFRAGECIQLFIDLYDSDDEEFEHLNSLPEVDPLSAVPTLNASEQSKANSAQNMLMKQRASELAIASIKSGRGPTANVNMTRSPIKFSLPAKSILKGRNSLGSAVSPKVVAKPEVPSQRRVISTSAFFVNKHQASSERKTLPKIVSVNALKKQRVSLASKSVGKSVKVTSPGTSLQSYFENNKTETPVGVTKKGGVSTNAKGVARRRPIKAKPETHNVAGGLKKTSSDVLWRASEGASASDKYIVVDTQKNSSSSTTVVTPGKDILAKALANSNVIPSDSIPTADVMITGSQVTPPIMQTVERPSLVLPHQIVTETSTGRPSSTVRNAASTRNSVNYRSASKLVKR